MIKKAVKTVLNIPTASGHASTLTLSHGKVFLAWFGGTKEGDPDVDIFLAVRENGRWSRPLRAAGEKGLPHWNPVLFAREGRITLYYRVGESPSRWHTRVSVSEDDGASWSAPAEIGNDGPVRNLPLTLHSGRILYPNSVETDTSWNAYVNYSDDGGKTLKNGAFVPLVRRGMEKPSGGKREPCIIERKGVIQPTLWQSENGGVHMLLRSTEGFILRSDSEDEGVTWCPAYSTELPNNNSGISLTRTQDGRLFLVLNPVSGDWAARTPLSLYVSADDGESFIPLMHLETNPGEYSYPTILAEEKKLYISYTWKREKIAFWEMELE